MADRLVVDGPALEAAARNVARIPVELQATAHALDVHESSLGPIDLREALASFEEHWAHGRDRLAAAAEDLAMTLRGSAAAFEAVDHAVGRAAAAPASRLEKGGA